MDKNALTRKVNWNTNTSLLCVEGTLVELEQLQQECATIDSVIIDTLKTTGIWYDGSILISVSDSCCELGAYINHMPVPCGFTPFL